MRRTGYGLFEPLLSRNKEVKRLRLETEFMVLGNTHVKFLNNPFFRLFFTLLFYMQYVFPTLLKLRSRISSTWFLNVSIMWCYFLVFSTVLTVITANPILDSSNGSGDLTIADGLNESGGVSLDAAADLNRIGTNPVILNSLPTSPIMIGDCSSDSSSEESIDGNIQKRIDFCPVPDDPADTGQPSTSPSTSETKKPTTSPRNPCPRDQPKYVTCGGTEYMLYEDAIFIAGVLNCVPGKSIIISHLRFWNWQLTASKRTIPERDLFLETWKVADYCCELFEDRVCWFLLFSGWENHLLI